MQSWIIRMRPLVCGGVTLGLFQAMQDINFNQIWFQFLLSWLSALITVLLGGDASTAFGDTTGSGFGSFFL